MLRTQLAAVILMLAGCGSEDPDRPATGDGGAELGADAAHDLTGDAPQSDETPGDGGDAPDAETGSCDPGAPVCAPACAEGEFCAEDCQCATVTVDAWWEADRAARVEASGLCGTLALSLRSTWDGRLPMSVLLPRPLFLVLADQAERSRQEAAASYTRAVLAAAHYARYDEVLQYGDFASLDRASQEAVVASVFLRDTLVSVGEVAAALDALCPGLGDEAADKAELPEQPGSRYGFSCPTPATPDCGAPEPPSPHDCPPALLDCPDCPYIQMAEEDLARLEAAYAAFDAAADSQRLLDLLGIYVESILETLATGRIPSPAGIAADLARVYLGADYPGLTFVIGVLTSVAEGTLAGGPLVGVGLGLWTAFSTWGDLSAQDDWNRRLQDARARVDAMRRYCREREWDARQAECRAREAARFAQRQAECAEAAASHAAQLSSWEAHNDACDAEQDAAEAATTQAWTITNYLRARGFGFTRAAYEACCDGPYPFEPDCPGSEITPDPIPLWGLDPRRDFLSLSALGGDRLVRGFGPLAGGRLTLDPHLGLRGEPRIPIARLLPSPVVTEIILLDEGWAGRFDRDGGFPLTSPTELGDFELTPEEPDPFGGAPRVPLALRIALRLGEGEAFTSEIPAAVEVWDNSIELHPLVAAGDDVFDVTGGGDFSEAPPWATTPAPIRALTHFNGLLLAATPGAIYDVTSGGDLSGAAPWATLPAGASLTGLREDAGGLWVTDGAHGAVYRVPGPGDHTGLTPSVTGLSWPVDVIRYSDHLLVSDAGAGRVLDVTALGPASTAPTWVALDGIFPQRFVAHPFRSLFVAGADVDGAGSILDVTTSGAHETAYTGVFNPAGFALHPGGVTWLVSEFRPEGSVVDLAEADATGSLEDAPRLATGLRNPSAIVFHWMRGEEPE